LAVVPLVCDANCAKQ